MATAERLHFTCPSCGGDFGWGDGAVLLTIVSSAPFDEPCPRCGTRLTGSVHRNGGIDFDPLPPPPPPHRGAGNVSDAQEELSPKRRGKAMTTWVGWLELNSPEAVTLEEYHRLRAEGDSEVRRATPRKR